jgi:hypothetical protein
MEGIGERGRDREEERGREGKGEQSEVANPAEWSVTIVKFIEGSAAAQTHST